MFSRRNPLPLLRRVAHVMWPRSGWLRYATYIGHRVRRLPGTPTRIAAGFACGVAVSFTPFIGFHFILAVALAALMRGNLIASAIGTAAGNPWTFPIIWAWTYSAGRWILGDDSVLYLPVDFSFRYIFDHPFKVLLPMTVGGIPTAAVAWAVAFFPLRGMISEYQRSRRRLLRRKVRKRLNAKQMVRAAEMAEK